MDRNRNRRIIANAFLLLIIGGGGLLVFIKDRQSVEPWVWILTLILTILLGYQLYEDISNKPASLDGINPTNLFGIILPAFFLITIGNELETFKVVILWIFLGASAYSLISGIIKKK